MHHVSHIAVAVKSYSLARVVVIPVSAASLQLAITCDVCSLWDVPLFRVAVIGMVSARFRMLDPSP